MLFEIDYTSLRFVLSQKGFARMWPHTLIRWWLAPSSDLSANIIQHGHAEARLSGFSAHHHTIVTGPFPSFSQLSDDFPGNSFTFPDYQNSLTIPGFPGR